jgi:glycine cleavage system H protein
MSQIEKDLKYANTHEWVRLENGIATVGISDHAQSELGELVYVELPEVGAEVMAGDEAGVVESVKAASDVYAPVSGKIIEVNDTLESTPDLVNSDAYGDGWLYRIRVSDEGEMDDLLNPEQYADRISE